MSTPGRGCAALPTDKVPFRLHSCSTDPPLGRVARIVRVRSSRAVIDFDHLRASGKGIRCGAYLSQRCWCWLCASRLPPTLPLGPSSTGPGADEPGCSPRQTLEQSHEPTPVGGCEMSLLSVHEHGQDAESPLPNGLIEILMLVALLSITLSSAAFAQVSVTSQSGILQGSAEVEWKPVSVVEWEDDQFSETLQIGSSGSINGGASVTGTLATYSVSAQGTVGPNTSRVDVYSDVAGHFLGNPGRGVARSATSGQQEMFLTLASPAAVKLNQSCTGESFCRVAFSGPPSGVSDPDCASGRYFDTADPDCDSMTGRAEPLPVGDYVLYVQLTNNRQTTLDPGYYENSAHAWGTLAFSFEGEPFPVPALGGPGILGLAALLGVGGAAYWERTRR